MAPLLDERFTDGPYTSVHTAKEPFAVSDTASKVLSYVPGSTTIDRHDNYEYEELRPNFPDIKWDALSEVPYHDKGLRGHPEFHNLLKDATDVFDYNPKIGTEVRGVNLARLTDTQKDDLARLIAVRGVVFFRGQVDFDIETQRKLGRYFGTLHKHATTSVPRKAGLEDVHVVYTDEKSRDQRATFTPTFLWHSDVSMSWYTTHMPPLKTF